MPHQLLFTSGIQRTGSKLLEWNNRQAEKYAIDRYGSVWGRCLANFAAAAVERQLRLEQDVIVGEDEDLMAFKQSLAGELSMIAVAGAIVAQIGVTAFALPNNQDIHWIVQGFFACGLAMGLLSVHFAVVQQRTMGKLHKASQVRMWLLANSSANLISEGMNPIKVARKVSFTVAFLTQLPYTTIFYGVFLLVIGLALYLGLSWQKRLHADDKGNSDRNTLIMYIIFTGASVMQWTWAYLSKSTWLEQRITLGDQKQMQMHAPGLHRAVPLQMMNADRVVAPCECRRASVVTDESMSLADALRHAGKIHSECADVDVAIAAKYELMAAESTHWTQPASN